MPTKKPTRPRPDYQTDYEDPADRLFRRPEVTKGGKLKKADNPVATVASALGLVSLIPCVGSVLGPIAVLLGIIGLVKASDPTVGGKSKAKAGLWFGLVGCVLYILLPIFFLFFARFR